MRTEAAMKRINYGFFVLVFIAGLCYDLSNGNIPIKTAASSCFVLQGLINLRYRFRKREEKRAFSLLLLWGLVLGLAADITLELNFMLGAGVFAVGHLFYILAYCRLIPLKGRDLLTGLPVFLVTGLMVLFLPIFDFGGGLMQGICMAYAGIISLMFGKAAANYRAEPCALTKLLAIGSFMFLFSDLMLLFGAFSSLVPGLFNSLCVNTYYPAQSVLAYALLRTEE